MFNLLQIMQDYEKSWTIDQLSNGIRCVCLPWRKDRRFTLQVMVAVGSRHDPEGYAGMSHMLEHMMFRGSRAYPTFMELAAQFERLGGEWNGETGHEFTEYSYVGIQEGWQRVVGLFADFFQAPAFENLDAERQIILRELDGDYNEFGNCIDIDWHISQMFWKDHALATQICGTPEILKAITIEDLERYRQSAYQPENIVIVVGGPDPKEAFAEVKRHFESYSVDGGTFIRKVEKPTFEQIESFRHVLNTDNEIELQLSFPGVAEFDEFDIELQILSSYLSDGYRSPLSRRIRDELGLVYSIEANCDLLSDTGTVNVSAVLLPDDINSFIQELNKILSEATKKVDENLWADAVKRCLVETELSYTHLTDIGHDSAWHYYRTGSPNLSSYVDKLRKTNSQRMLQIAQRIFHSENALCVIGPKLKSSIQPVVVS